MADETSKSSSRKSSSGGSKSSGSSRSKSSSSGGSSSRSKSGGSKASSSTKSRSTSAKASGTGSKSTSSRSKSSNGGSKSTSSRSRSKKSGIETRMEEIEVAGGELVDSVKGIIEQGNVRRLIIRNSDGDVVMETPLTLGIALGSSLVTVLLAGLGAMAAMLAKVKIQVEREEKSMIEETREREATM